MTRDKSYYQQADSMTRDKSCYQLADSMTEKRCHWQPQDKALTSFWSSEWQNRKIKTTSKQEF